MAPPTLLLYLGSAEHPPVPAQAALPESFTRIEQNAELEVPRRREADGWK